MCFPKTKYILVIPQSEHYAGIPKTIKFVTFMNIKVQLCHVCIIIYTSFIFQYVVILSILVLAEVAFVVVLFAAQNKVINVYINNEFYLESQENKIRPTLYKFRRLQSYNVMTKILCLSTLAYITRVCHVIIMLPLKE